MTRARYRRDRRKAAGDEDAGEMSEDEWLGVDGELAPFLAEVGRKILR